MVAAEGKAETEGRTTSDLGLDIDRPTVTLDDAVGDGETKSGPCPFDLGREKRFEDAVPQLFGDPDPCVLYLEDDGVGGVEAGPYRQGPSVGHRVERVEDEREDGLLELRSIADQLGQVGPELQLEPDAPEVRTVLHEPDRSLDDRIDLGGLVCKDTLT